MSTVSSSHRRRSVVATSVTAFLVSIVVAGAFSLLPTHRAAAAGDDAIRPFKIHVSEEALVDLRQRVQATRWPDKETVSDES
jgi:hypothetical protein